MFKFILGVLTGVIGTFVGCIIAYEVLDLGAELKTQCTHKNHDPLNCTVN